MCSHLAGKGAGEQETPEGRGLSLRGSDNKTPADKCVNIPTKRLDTTPRVTHSRFSINSPVSVDLNQGHLIKCRSLKRRWDDLITLSWRCMKFAQPTIFPRDEQSYDFTSVTFAHKENRNPGQDFRVAKMSQGNTWPKLGQQLQKDRVRRL